VPPRTGATLANRYEIADASKKTKTKKAKSKATSVADKKNLEQEPSMIDIYSWATPNGHKIHIMLEETGLEYKAHPINIGAGDQFTKEFLAISPNNKIPAIVDTDGPKRADGAPFALFESGAILLYLAEKTGKFLPTDPAARYETLQWLMFQMGGVGPMLGQTHHFRVYAPQPIEYAINRYTNEAKRLYGVMDTQLGKTRYLAGNDYTIADIATFPWTRSWQNQGLQIDDFPNVKRWHEEIAARPAVQRGVEVLASARVPLMDDKAKEMLFGATQYAKH
jgi:GST-like protein